MKEDIEQRAEEITNIEYPIGASYHEYGHWFKKGVIQGATEERERGKRFAEWLFKNNLYFVNDDIFNSFLAEEKELNN